MSAINLAVANSLVKPAVKSLLQILASRKRAQLNDLAEDLKRVLNTNIEVAESVAKSGLEELKGLQFVEEKPAVLPRWNTYSVTADGLEAARKLL
jgi:hypothetical protein